MQWQFYPGISGSEAYFQSESERFFSIRIAFPTIFLRSGTAILPEIRVREPGSGDIDWQDRTGSRITGHTGTHVSAQPGQLLRKADPQVALNLRRHSTVYYRCGGT